MSEGMKQVKAFIRPEMLEHVENCLKTIPNLPGLAITRTEGYGRGRDGVRKLVERIEVQVVVRAGMADAVVEAIRGAAHTGRSGDGKIFVTTVDRAVRISTGEENEEAL